MRHKQLVVLAILFFSIPSLSIAADRGWYVGGDFGNTTYDSLEQFEAPFTNAASNFIADPTVNASVVSQESAVVAAAVASGFDASSVFDTSLTGGSDDSDTATLGIFAGYRFSKHFAVELAYTQLGDYDARALGNNFATVTITDPLSTPPDELVDIVTVGEAGNSTANLEASAFSVSVLGSLPIGKNHSVYGKVGMARWDTDLTVRSNATIAQNFIPGQIRVGNFDDDGTDAVFGVGYQGKITKSASIRVAYDVYTDIAVSDFNLEDDIERISIGFLFDL